MKPPIDSQLKKVIPAEVSFTAPQVWEGFLTLDFQVEKHLLWKVLAKNITIRQGMVDVNVTPDKKTVFLHQEV